MEREKEEDDLLLEEEGDAERREDGRGIPMAGMKIEGVEGRDHVEGGWGGSW